MKSVFHSPSLLSSAINYLEERPAVARLCCPGPKFWPSVVRTGSGRDRVAVLPGSTVGWIEGPVATAPGSDLIAANRVSGLSGAVFGNQAVLQISGLCRIEALWANVRRDALSVDSIEEADCVKAPDRQAETADLQAETSGGQAEAAGGRAETAGGRAEAAGGRAETSGGQAEAAGGRAETSGGQAETSGGRAESSGGRAETDRRRPGPGGAAADQQVSVTLALAAQVRRLNKTSFQSAFQAFSWRIKGYAASKAASRYDHQAGLRGWGLPACRTPKSAIALRTRRRSHRRKLTL
jgi:hypothetical protein